MESTQQGSAAGEAVSSAKEQASSVASSATDEARTVARDASMHAREVVGEARHQLMEQASQQTERLSGTLRQVSDQLRGMGDGQAPQPGIVSDLTRQLAETTNGFASRLESGGLDGAMEDVRRFARNRPGMFLVAAAGTGFVVGRLLRAMDTGSVMDAAKQSMSPDDGASSDDSAMSMQPSMAATPLAGGAPLGLEA